MLAQMFAAYIVPAKPSTGVVCLYLIFFFFYYREKKIGQIILIAKPERMNR